MTFAFKAIGSKDEVLGQLASYDDRNYGDLGKAVRSLVTDQVSKASGTSFSDSWDIKYIVEGNGHGDASTCSFTVTVTSHWVPQVKPKEAGSEAPASTDTGSQPADLPTNESAPVAQEASAQSGEVTQHD